MVVRTSPVVLAFALMVVGCAMDNPAFDPGGETSDAGEPASTTGIGDSPDEDPVPVGGDCGQGVPCPPCQVCDDQTDTCIPAPAGEACEGPQLECSEFLLGIQGEACVQFADATLTPQCDEHGQCKAPIPSECPAVAGKVLATCDPLCMDAEICSAFAPVAEIDAFSICVLNGVAPECGSYCSIEDNAFVTRQCVDGTCTQMSQAMCDPYICDKQGVACYATCQTDFQCVELMKCAGGTCK